MTTPPTSPRESLAHTLEVFAYQPDSAMAVVATRNIPTRGAVTGLTWGDLRALAAEAGTTAASTALSPDYLAEIAARAEAVTDGPWGPHLGVTTNVFIAHARADVPALLAEVERLRAALSSATDVIAERDDEIGDWSAKNARLRAELTTMTTVAQSSKESALGLDLDLQAANEEIERLRAELADRPTRAEAPRTERSRWQAVADALNDLDIAGIDLDGTIAGHNAWSVVRDRDAGWMVSGYDAEAGESR